MDWSRWLRDFAIYGTIAAALVVWLRTAGAARLLAKLRDAVGAWTPGTALLVVLAATAAPRMAVALAVDAKFDTDVQEYVQKAEAIADTGTPRSQETRADGTVFYRPMGSSLALAVWYRLTGTRGFRSARVEGVALACAAAWLILVLGRTLGREMDGRLAALGYALLAHQVVFATLPYTETFVTVLVLAISVTFERLRRGRGRILDAVGLGLAEGLLAITRTELAWVAVLTAVLLVSAGRKAGRKVLLPVAVSLLAALVPPVGNATLRSGYPGLVRTSSQGGLILYFGNNPIEVNGQGNATPEVAAKVRAMYDRDPTGTTARDEALAWIAAHPFEAAANAPKKVFHLWLGEPQGLTWQLASYPPTTALGWAASHAARGLAYVQSLLVLALGVMGWRRLGPERRLWTMTLALHLAVWCLLAASARNRYPLEPWLLLAAAAWVETASRSPARRSAPAVPRAESRAADG